MTDADSNAREYVCRLLQLNPLEQAEEVLAHRQNFLEPGSASRLYLDERELNFNERKQQLKSEMQALRNNFWQFDDRLLQKQLNALEVDEFPNLGFALNRLKKVAALRDSFQRLKHHPACFEAFYDQFCQLVIAPPEEADALRTVSSEPLSVDELDFEISAPEDYRRASAMIKEDFPELYELEKYWLNQVAVMGIETSPIHRKVNILYSCIITALVLILLIGMLYLPGITIITIMVAPPLVGVCYLVHCFAVKQRSAQ